MHTRALGDAAEAAVLNAFVQLGVPVLVPFGRFGRYDLVVEPRPGALVRVQVKAGRVRDGCVAFNSAGTDHGRGRLPYAGDADVFAVHVRELDRRFVVPVEAASVTVTRLRLVPAGNNQRAGVRLAAEHDLAAWVERARADPAARAA